jgi:hypothetical protein
MSGIFADLPTELLGTIFLLVSSFRELGVLSQTCKRFCSLIAEDEQFWKRLCLDWWKEVNVTTTFTLEGIAKETKKTWVWFAQCISNNTGVDLVYVSAPHRTVDLWLGEIKNGQLSGFGVHVSGTSLRFGEFQNGSLSGPGVRVLKDSRLEGNFVDGKADGYAKIVFFDHRAESYEGEWSKGLFHGKGIFRWKRGEVYEGEFKENMRNGRGRMKLSTHEFECEWKENSPLGSLVSQKPNFLKTKMRATIQRLRNAWTKVSVPPL